MSEGNWDWILQDYQYAQKKDGGEIYMWMEVVVMLLMENRDLSTLYPINKDNVLSAFIGKHYEFHHKPIISIELNHENRAPSKDKYKIKFSFISKGHEDGNLYRQNKELIYCPVENSLEVFDELFEKLKAVTTSLPIYQKISEK